MHRIVRHVRRQPVAYAALFFAMTGTGIAAGPVITGSNVKNSSLTGADIKNSSLTSSDVRDGSLLSKDFKAGQIPAGAKGQKGDTGATGAPGANGATNVVMRQGPSVTVIHGSFAKAEVSCHAGERATGGGVYNESNILVLKVTSSYPTPNPTTPPATGDGLTPTGWRVWLANESATTDYAVNAYVICAAP